MQLKENPYESPKSNGSLLQRMRVKSRVWFFVVPTIFGFFIGSQFPVAGFARGQNRIFALEAVAAVGGLIGLVVGMILYGVTSSKT